MGLDLCGLRTFSRFRTFELGLFSVRGEAQCRENLPTGYLGPRHRYVKGSLLLTRLILSTRPQIIVTQIS